MYRDGSGPFPDEARDLGFPVGTRASWLYDARRHKFGRKAKPQQSLAAVRSDGFRKKQPLADATE